MPKKHWNNKVPKAGSKIAYMLSTKDIHFATVFTGKEENLEIFPTEVLKINQPCYLSDYTPWRNIRIWWYEDENYNYGKDS
ncbi:MAG: hypothetical protein ACP5D6_06445 [Kosmotogaceae bacterium]